MPDAGPQKTALVTGSASGLGRQLALDLAAEGWAVALTDVDQAGLKETQKEMAASSATVSAFAADLTDPSSARLMVQNSISRQGRLDALFLCAGISMWARFDHVDDLSSFDRLMRINYFGALYCIHAALGELRRSHGSIVAVSSLQGEIALPHHSGYSASKHALNGLIDALEFEMGEEVHFLTVMPGWIRGTNLRKNALREEGADEKPRKHSSDSVSVEEASRRILAAHSRQKRRLYIPSKLGHLRWLRIVAPGLVKKLILRAVDRQRS